MSRSNPSANGNPNPATRWFEWNGEKGVVRYYDKVSKVNVTVPLPFEFILLDQLAVVKGWHEASESGIYSNEVRNTSESPLTVKSFKGGVLAEGLYKDIKDRVSKAGGKFNANLYIGYDDGAGDLKLGSLQFKGAALSAWMDFRKAQGNAIYEQAIAITGSVSGKKGRVVFETPTFELTDLDPEVAEAAFALDVDLQRYLTGYFARGAQTTPAAAAAAEEEEFGEEVAVD